MEHFNNIFDSHAHYDDSKFDGDRDDVLSVLPSKGVCGVVNNAVNLKSAEFSLKTAEKYRYFYATVGFHPESLDDITPNYLDEMERLLRHKKAVAIGEIGLDYHWDTPHDLQKREFERQLAFSKDVDYPVVVHDREAHGDTLTLLKKYRPTGLVHCFSGSAELMKEVIRLGMYISLGGVVTFKNARHSIEVAAEVPLDRLLLETDAPYMAPVPFRGSRCDSSMIIYCAEKIATLRGLTTQQLLDITKENAERLYRIEV